MQKGEELEDEEKKPEEKTKKAEPGVSPHRRISTQPKDEKDDSEEETEEGEGESSNRQGRGAESL